MFRGFLIFCAMAQLGGTVSDRPIVGIMTMDLERSFKLAYPGHDSYIAASYVKAVEGAGARAVPIFIGQSEAYYWKMAESINGLLIPGGGARFNGTDNFFAASKMMYDLALKMNGNNVHFPVFGVCLGFELLLRFASDDENVRRSCKGGVIHHVNMPLKFVSGFKKSSLFKSLPKRTSRALQTNITINNHVTISRGIIWKMIGKSSQHLTTYKATLSLLQSSMQSIRSAGFSFILKRTSTNGAEPCLSFALQKPSRHLDTSTTGSSARPRKIATPSRSLI
ncbi:gamma-glutamyl hydrolase isoform X2 [Bemisia tabaci]|uniref:gamma-glutamyl hydrolase isoform X2 n=1 Tax=Bemisia tabaci TaxID=7038 RepID=UPI003B27F1B1